MHWYVSIIAGLAVGFAWLVILALVLRAFGIDFFFRQTKDHDERRERIKQLGQLRYVLIFGVLGYGVAFGLTITTTEFLDGYFPWTSAVRHVVFWTVSYGLLQGIWTWSEYRDPVPFPPKYPPAK